MCLLDHHFLPLGNNLILLEILFFKTMMELFSIHFYKRIKKIKTTNKL